MKVSFTVPGQPVGKGRPRFARRGNHVSTYTPAKTADYENLIRLEYERQCQGWKFDDGAYLDVRVTAYFRIPKSVSRKKRQAMEDRKIRPTGKPDLTNVAKSVEDGLNGVAYRDDSQIVTLYLRKYFSDEPRVVVTIQDTE